MLNFSFLCFCYHSLKMFSKVSVVDLFILETCNFQIWEGSYYQCKEITWMTVQNINGNRICLYNVCAVFICFSLYLTLWLICIFPIAVALNYGIFRRKDFNETAQYIMFYDMGATSTSAAVVSYQLVKTKEKGYVETNPQLSIIGVG